MQKKLDWLKISLLVKNLQFSFDPAEISAILSTHELVILTKFHKDWPKIVDFLVIAKFWASQIFFASVSIFLTCEIPHYCQLTPLMKMPQL